MREPPFFSAICRWEGPFLCFAWWSADELVRLGGDGDRGGSGDWKEPRPVSFLRDLRACSTSVSKGAKSGAAHALLDPALGPGLEMSRVRLEARDTSTGSCERSAKGVDLLAECWVSAVESPMEAARPGRIVWPSLSLGSLYTSSTRLGLSLGLSSSLGLGRGGCSVEDRDSVGAG